MILIYYQHFIIDPYGACIVEDRLTTSAVTIEIHDDNEEVIIISPGYPESYPSNADCQWHFRTDEGYILAVNFTVFEMEKE